jgi:hypothetical protein
MMNIDIEKVLLNLGIDYDNKGHEANGLCPMHEVRTGKKDNSPSWWINLESGQHICFSCHYKGNLLQLVCDANEFYKKGWNEDYVYDYKAAEIWLSQISAISLERLKDIVSSLPNYLEPAPKPVAMSEARLAIFDEPPVEALNSRNITPESAVKYGVLWDTKKATWILPLRDPDSNKLLGWQEKGTVNRTFFNRPTGLTKSKTLFGLQNQSEDLVVVVESPLDCLRLYSAGVASAVAICGSSPSEEQIKLLRASDRIICAFDNPKLDDAGKKASGEIRELARKYGLNLSFFNYGDSGKKDPGDMTDEEIRWGIENSRSAILGEKAYV